MIEKIAVEPEPKSLGRNPNVEWVYGKGIWVIYAMVILVPRFLLSLFVGRGPSWIITHFVHNLITFILFHWIKGHPFSSMFSEQGKYDRLTFWEQLDSGEQYTPTRKYLTVIPILLFSATTYYTVSDYGVSWLLFNLSSFVPVIVGKFAIMHRVRMFGINAE